MKVTALLPFKLNSERIPNKNFKNLYNKPLYSWVLDTLLSINIIDNVIVNTDAIDVLHQNNVYSTNKLYLKHREKDLCGDKINMNKIIENDIKNDDSDIFIMTHTTNPFLTSNTIINAINIFKNCIERNINDSLFTVNKYQTRFYKKDGTAINHDPNNLIRTQDLEIWYEENSNLYLFTKASFYSTNARIGKKPYLLETQFLESIDIDTIENWKLAEIIANNKFI